MNSFNEIIESVVATDVWFAGNKLWVRLADDREVGLPLILFPRLFKATEAQRNNWRFIGAGQGIHWEDVDEDLSVEGLLSNQILT